MAAFFIYANCFESAGNGFGSLRSVLRPALQAGTDVMILKYFHQKIGKNRGFDS
jgi:hypothetical protein